MDKKKTLIFLESAIRNVFTEVAYNVKYENYDKAQFDEVTSLDYCIEKRLIETIKSYDNDARFLSEEYNSTVEPSECIWIIDPIDGTCNLTHGINTYGVQCAYCEKGNPVIAAIYFPFSDEMFTAIEGDGAKLNGVRIEASSRQIERSLVSFGDFMRDEAVYRLEHKIMGYVAKKVERIRMYGAASIDFCYAACGRLDGAFTFTKNKWDILPGLLMCREAGLIISDVYGAEYSVDNSDTIAVFSTKELYQVCTDWWK